jgi:hypothetical protein
MLAASAMTTHWSFTYGTCLFVARRDDRDSPSYARLGGRFGRGLT